MVGKGLVSESQIGAYTGESRLIELRSPPNNLHKGREEEDGESKPARSSTR